tara:strand:+ start:625 stop:816 length:192 start_codon:yes stop_codon:yes gene_type:complete
LYRKGNLSIRIALGSLRPEEALFSRIDRFLKSKKRKVCGQKFISIFKTIESAYDYIFHQGAHH